MWTLTKQKIVFHMCNTWHQMGFIVPIRLFLKNTLANGVKVVKKVITSKFRFHLIAIYALGCFHNFSCTPEPKLPWRAPNPHETSERMNFNVIDKKQLIWKLFIYWYLMSCFHKENVKKCLGHHYAIWTSDSNFLLAGPHFRHCYTRDNLYLIVQ